MSSSSSSPAFARSAFSSDSSGPREQEHADDEHACHAHRGDERQVRDVAEGVEERGDDGATPGDCQEAEEYRAPTGYGASRPPRGRPWNANGCVCPLRQMLTGATKSHERLTPLPAVVSAASPSTLTGCSTGMISKPNGALKGLGVA